MKQLSAEELQAGMDEILRSPRDAGLLEMIVRRPDTNERETLAQAELSVTEGLVGDNWSRKRSSMTADGSAHPEMQINIMNSRVIALVAATEDRWPLAGDQLYVDLDLGKDNLPGGARLQIGTAVLEVSEIPHLGCKKFAARFGVEAMKFVNSGLGKQRCFRGINAQVVEPGIVHVGDRVTKLA